MPLSVQPIISEVLRSRPEPRQFTSWAFTERAKASGLTPSMGSVGDCFDNAVIEAFWSRMQVELLDPPTLEHPPGSGQRDLRVP